MRFIQSALHNFRNFPGAARFSWTPGLNVIVGANGAGKTNLLESLSVLSGWGAFARRVSGVVSWDSRDGRTQLAANVTGEDDHEIEARISSLTTLRVDGKRETSTNLRLVMPTVTFLPTDTGLIDGSPSVRRAFIDRLCALCIPVYARRLADFRKVSVRRSGVLTHGGVSTAGVTAIDAVFVRLGGWLMEARRAMVARLVERLGRDSVASEPFRISITPDFRDSGENFLASEMRRMYDRERAAGRVLVGPGRMDLEITVSGRPVSEVLSRGQKRRVVLSLVLGAARVTENIIRRSPVLLLDDVAAELDMTGREAAFEALCKTGWQVILTGVEDPFPSCDSGVKTVYKLRSEFQNKELPQPDI